MSSTRTARSIYLLLVLSFLVLLTLLLVAKQRNTSSAAAQVKRKSGQVLAEVIHANSPGPASAPALQRSGFTPQIRLGYHSGDQWEPAIATDRFGHVYVLYPQYMGVPGCPTCPSPTMILQISNDGGKTWDSPGQIASPGSGQWDAQIVVDPLDGQTVYAAWLQNGKSDTVVAKSTDFGATWQVVVADHSQAGMDKPILVVNGQDVYVGFNHAQKIWVSSSHDGGQTFTSTNVNPNGRLGWALASGGTIDPQGRVYFGWAGYERNGGAKGPVNLFVSRSDDGGQTWTINLVDISGSPPDCSDFLCGWAYLGAQISIASDETGTLYALWNAGQVDKGPERMYFARSMDGGATWASQVDISTAQPGANHAFPAIWASADGNVRLAWMDDRAVRWNTYYRSSADGGATWSDEADLSTFVPGYDYIHSDGFNFPFGDYFELDVDGRGVTHLIWGEGKNYDSPGSIWYTRGN